MTDPRTDGVERAEHSDQGVPGEGVEGADRSEDPRNEEVAESGGGEAAPAPEVDGSGGSARQNGSGDAGTSEQEATAPGEAIGSGEDAESLEEVHEPSKLVRLSHMIQQLLTEVRESGLDEQTRVRVRALVSQTAGEVGEALSPDLRDELGRLRALWEDEAPPSQAELLIEQAQLTGWLEGVLNGIRTALSAEQAEAQQGLNQMDGPEQGG